MNRTDIMRRAKEAKAFLDGHPALITDYTFSPCYTWWISLCCKHGMDECVEKMGVRIYWGLKNGKKYEKEFKEQYGPKELSDPLTGPFCSITKPYEEIYGEPWKLHHAEYRFETSFFVYNGDFKKKPNDSAYMDPRSWGAYQGPEGWARTFEQMLCKMAEMVRKAFGDFCVHWDFHTKEERENNKGLSPFARSKFEPGQLTAPMRLNPKYIMVPTAAINRRWLAWYVKTEHCKKQWKDEFDRLVEEVPDTFPPQGDKW